MIKHEMPTMELDEEVTFKGIPDELYDEVMTEFDETLQRQMRQNEIRESKSIEFAAKFITTV